MTAAIEAINPLDDTARIRAHVEMETEGQFVEQPPAPMLEAMSDAELVAVILHDPDYWERRKALTIVRMREYKAGASMAVSTFERVTR